MSPSPKTNFPASIKKKLKSCDLEIQNYVTALKTENLKLHKEIAKFQVENVSLNNRINALTKEINNAGARFFAEIIKRADEHIFEK